MCVSRVSQVGEQGNDPQEGKERREDSCVGLYPGHESCPSRPCSGDDCRNHDGHYQPPEDAQGEFKRMGNEPTMNSPHSEAPSNEGIACQVVRPPMEGIQNRPTEAPEVPDTLHVRCGRQERERGWNSHPEDPTSREPVTGPSPKPRFVRHVFDSTRLRFRSHNLSIERVRIGHSEFVRPGANDLA